MPKKATTVRKVDKVEGWLRTLNLLTNHYPDAHCALHHRNAFELLVATILSAQCTDERVNQVTPALFSAAPTAADLARLSEEKIASLVRSTGFYQNKAKNLKAMAEILVREHNGEVPQNMEALVKLPGVGRKTANVVLGNAFGIASGIVVDTHVGRLARRLGWTKNEDPVKVENDLCKWVPKKNWVLFSHLLISHGRALCQARSPKCDSCFLIDPCPRRGVK